MKVIKFGAIWCKECIVMRSIWEEIEEEFPELKTEYFDADMNPAELAEYAVEKIPTFIFLDAQNQEIIRLSGAQNKSDLIEKVKANLGTS